MPAPYRTWTVLQCSNEPKIAIFALHALPACRFFFYFQARVEPDDAPVVLWMTGGPGCSSELAVFFENGKHGTGLLLYLACLQDLEARQPAFLTWPEPLM